MSESARKRSAHRFGRRRFDAVLVLIVCACGLPAGCSRTHYRMRADEDAYSILSEKAYGRPWTPPHRFTVQPSPESRLFDPSAIENPRLPDPRPWLHTYQIPPHIGRPPDPWPEHREADKSDNDDNPQTDPEMNFGHSMSFRPDVIHAGGFFSESDVVPESAERILLTRLAIQDDGNPDVTDAFEVVPVTIPPDAWQSIPPACLRRMIEFASVRDEYVRSFASLPPESERDQSPQLGLDDIIRLALLNSREYQAQKELLYRVALRLTLERYDYQLKFAPFRSPFASGAGAFFLGQRTNDAAFSTLRLPSQVETEQMLNTGTDVLTRFANQVLLTFNGPDGFAADVSSEMLFQLTHSVFQNDVRFESLTQAERNVVYAARDFARFRRTFYLALATQYYNLIRTYRQVEIDAQNYLSLSHSYSQRMVELDEGQTARLQIDQVEQNALAGRSRLIGTCNNLENAVDQLKIRIGLPTETPINIDLRELDQLTLQDEMLVALELVHRASQRLIAEQTFEDFDEANSLNGAAELVARIREVVEVRERLNVAIDRLSSASVDNATDDTVDPSDEILQRLELQQAQLRVYELRVLVNRSRKKLIDARNDPQTPPYRIPELAMRFTGLALESLAQENDFSRLLDADPPIIERNEQARLRLAAKLDERRASASKLLSEVQLDRLDELRRRTVALAVDAEGAVEQAMESSNMLARSRGLNPDRSTRELIEDPLQEGRALLDESDSGLPEVQADMDAASLVALWMRFDLMNSRGFLADDWRLIKLAADDLKSVLNLQARQRLISQGTDSDRGGVIDFDRSRTELSVTLDAPLNRRLQRNDFREQILNYQSSRRAIMAQEDSIKQAVRSDVRTLRLAKEQHALAIASAALASERVISTNLQLSLGVGGVRARDFLEAQTAYAASLSAVASRRIDHILGRVRLFVDLEQLQVDNDGRWSGLHDADRQPAIELPAGVQPNYDHIPADIHYSDEMLQGLGVR